MKVKVLLLGHNGMLGNAVYKYLQEDKNIELVTMTKRWGDAGFEGEIKLLPETSTKFFYEGENDRQIEFQLDKNNKVIKVWLVDSGLIHEFKITP